MGNATEFTQLLNKSELVGLVGQSAEQIQNQVTQITQLAEQIQNQIKIKIYKNMLQNTLQLPGHIWGQVEGDGGQAASFAAGSAALAWSGARAGASAYSAARAEGSSLGASALKGMTAGAGAAGGALASAARDKAIGVPETWGASTGWAQRRA